MNSRAYKRVVGWSALLTLSLATWITPVTGQEVPQAGDTEPAGFPPGVEAVNRIVAIVGDTVVLRSDLDMAMFQLQSQGIQIPPEGSDQWRPFAENVLEAMIDDLINLQQAKRAGITPTPDDIDERAEEFYQERRGQFRSDEEMMQAVESSGMNMLQYRQLLRSQASADLTRRLFFSDLQRRQDLPSVIVTEEEIQEAFDEFVRNEPPRPGTISFNQLVVTPSPSGTARDSAEARTLRVINDLNADEDFAVIARRHSDDEGTREQGGELGWMSQDGLVVPFADAAWRARPGQTVGPIQTQFGLHFIKVERARGAERFIRHVLLRPDIKPEDLEAARELAYEVQDSLAAGVDPELLVGYFRGRVAEEQIRFDDIPISQLQARYTGDEVAELTNPEIGRVYGPLEWQRGGPTEEFVLLHVIQYRPPGPFELDEVRDGIIQNLRSRKQIQMLVEEIRDGTFIDVRL